MPNEINEMPTSILSEYDDEIVIAFLIHFISPMLFPLVMPKELGSKKLGITVAVDTVKAQGLASEANLRAELEKTDIAMNPFIKVIRDALRPVANRDMLSKLCDAVRSEDEDGELQMLLHTFVSRILASMEGASIDDAKVCEFVGSVLANIIVNTMWNRVALGTLKSALPMLLPAPWNSTENIMFIQDKVFAMILRTNKDNMQGNHIIALEALKKLVEANFTPKQKEETLQLVLEPVASPDGSTQLFHELSLEKLAQFFVSTSEKLEMHKKQLAETQQSLETLRLQKTIEKKLKEDEVFYEKIPIMKELLHIRHAELEGDKNVLREAAKLNFNPALPAELKNVNLILDQYEPEINALTETQKELDAEMDRLTQVEKEHLAMQKQITELNALVYKNEKLLSAIQVDINKAEKDLNECGKSIVEICKEKTDHLEAVLAAFVKHLDLTINNGSDVMQRDQEILCDLLDQASQSARGLQDDIKYIENTKINSEFSLNISDMCKNIVGHENAYKIMIQSRNLNEYVDLSDELKIYIERLERYKENRSETFNLNWFFLSKDKKNEKIESIERVIDGLTVMQQHIAELKSPSNAAGQKLAVFLELEKSKSSIKEEAKTVLSRSSFFFQSEHKKIMQELEQRLTRTVPPIV